MVRGLLVRGNVFLMATGTARVARQALRKTGHPSKNQVQT